MYATHRKQGNVRSTAVHSKSSTRATTKTTQKTAKGSKKGHIATVQHVNHTAPASAPIAAPQHSHQSQNFTYASDSAPEAAEEGEAIVADDGKKIFVNRREQRELDRATFRRKDKMVQFVDADDDVQTAAETPIEWVKCSKAEYVRWLAEDRRYEAEIKQWELENRQKVVRDDIEYRPIVSKAEARRFQRAQAFENKEESLQEEGDIRPMATARDMKTRKRLAWDASDKQGTTGRRQDRD